MATKKISTSELKVYADLYKKKLISKKEFTALLRSNLSTTSAKPRKKKAKQYKGYITGDKETDKLLKQAGIDDIALMFKAGGKNTIQAGKDAIKISKSAIKQGKATYKAGKEGYAQAKVGAKKTKEGLKVGYAKSKVGAKKTKELSKKGLSATKGFLKRLSPSEIKKSKVKFDEKKKKKDDQKLVQSIMDDPTKLTKGESSYNKWLKKNQPKQKSSSFGSVKLRFKR
tara:strand:+ start:2678 stop:3358 length:681 start_codon:yes stop_codon:yes gene_type:complete